MKPLLVLNPASSGGKAGRLFPALRRPIELALGECEVAFTERAGHATEIAREAARAGRERIIAIGGDGTFSEVAAGVVESGARAKVGLIHQGTGGDFRRSLGLEHRLDRYLAAVSSGRTRAVDVGRLEHADRAGNKAIRHFVNVASIGMGGLVDKYVGEGNRLFGASSTYFAAAVKSLVAGSVGHLSCDVTLDGATRTVQISTRNFAVCNGQFFGSGMQVAPMARLDDGVFELIAIGGEARLPTLSVSASLYDGAHLGRRHVQHLRANAVTIRLENQDVSNRFLLDCDGEWAGGAPLRIECLPGALDVFC